MKVTDIRTAEVRGHGYSTYVRIYTDEGLTGTGECIHGGAGCPALIHDLKHLIVGENPLNVDMLWEKMRRAHIFNGALAGNLVTAMTGIEIALWDLVGKAHGLPLYQLFGGKFRDRVRLYCDSHAGRDETPASYAERANEVVALGFRALKFDVDDFKSPYRYDRWNWSAPPGEVAQMVERVAAVREAIGPDIEMAIDMHGRYDTQSGIRVAQAMEPFNLMWLEEPVPPENIAALREVKRHTATPICAGENAFLRWGFREMIEQQAVDVVMPDIPKCGGLSECRRIAAMADTYYIAFSPHNVCGPLGTMASAHICASVPNFQIIEWHWVDRPHWNELVQIDQPVIQEGAVVLTDKPGIGLEIDEDAVRNYLRPGTELFAAD